MVQVHIKGVQKISMIDYPGKIASVVFLSKCNMRCPFCHNPELVFCNDEEFPDITVEEFLDFLDTKKKWIDAVCITGGEPTLHPGLKELISRIKSKGLLVKLDTNGTNPNLLSDLIEQRLVDFVAMDVKNSYSRYDETTSSRVNIENISISIRTIITAGEKGIIDYEFRTTLLPRFFTEQDITKIAKMLEGSKKYVLQQFHKQDSLVDENFKQEATFTHSELHGFQHILQKTIPIVEIRD